MTFPKSDRVIFDQNPIEEVICQLRFPTILEISTEKPANFQNKVRDFYPLFETDQQILPREIADILSRFPMAKQTETITYKFISEDSKKLIALNPAFIAISDKDYIRWEQFSKEIVTAKKSLEEIYKPAFYTRIGLRYKDVIDKEILNIGGEKWQVLLKPFLTGLLGVKDVSLNIVNIKTEATIELKEVEGGMVTIRHGIERSGPSNREVYVIDADFYTNKRSKGQDAFTILRIFNELAGNFFRWVITDRLREALGPKKLQPMD